MDDASQPQAVTPGYKAPEFEPVTDREHTAKSTGYRDGYREGRDDLLFSLARRHQWALTAFARERERAEKEAALTHSAPAAQSTPGPWEWCRERNYGYGYSVLWNPETRQEVLATGGRNEGDAPVTWMGEEMSDADRALIEAAPNLLEELKQARATILELKNSRWSEAEGPDEGWVRGIDAAIAKAEGRP